MEYITDNKKEIPTFTVIGCCLICKKGNPHGGRIYCPGTSMGLSTYKGEYDYCDEFELRDGMKK